MLSGELPLPPRLCGSSRTLNPALARYTHGVTGDLAAEVRAVRETVGIADRGGRAFTLLDGPDALRFLQGMVTNDVDAIAVGSAHYALLLTPKARVVADMRLTRLAETTFLADADPAAATALRSVLTRYRLASKLTIDACDERFGIVAVAGPAATALLADALGVAPSADADEGAGTEAALPAGAVHVLRSAFTGEQAFELVGPRDALDQAWERLGAALGRHDGRVFGDEAFDVLRVEAGLPRFGAEIDDRVMPAEAGVVERAVSFTKGCYIGQEPVARLHYRGHANRGLRSILLDGTLPEAGAAVQVEGRDVGRITSAVESPTIGRAVALAIVRREVDPGQRVGVVTAGGVLEGELSAVPAYRWRA
jgi:folate-binding protein YgfZ